MLAGQELPCYLITAPSKKQMLLRMTKPYAAGLILPCEPEGTVMEIKHWLKEREIPVDTFESAMDFSEFKLNSDGMIPAIVQDYKTGEVLMLAYMNQEAYETTVRTGRMTYYSRSRKCLWVKGETSGHFQYVKSLIAWTATTTRCWRWCARLGPACHTGGRILLLPAPGPRRSTGRPIPLKVFEDVYGVILDRKAQPQGGLLHQLPVRQGDRQDFKEGGRGGHGDRDRRPRIPTRRR